MKVAITSGYFNPIHPGHVDCFKLSKELADALVVIVSNDEQAKLKRNTPSFQDEDFRMSIVSAIRYVDYVFLSKDLDATVCKSIKGVVETIKKQYPDATFIFTKGGDRLSSEIPERLVCEELGIEIVDGLGEKVAHSRDYIGDKNEN